MTTVSIRPAAPADAPALAELAERTFRDAFAARNTVADMDLHCASFYGAEIQRREIEDPGVDILLAEEGAALLAYAQIHHDASPSCVAAVSPSELRRIYVRQAWHGSGLADALLEAVLGRCRQRGADVLWLGVWEHNPRAIRFYEKRAFVAVGEQVFLLGNDPQRDLVMVRSLADTATPGAGEVGSGGG